MTTPEMWAPPDCEVGLTAKEWLELVWLGHCCSRKVAKDFLCDRGAFPSQLTAYLDHVRNLPFVDRIGDEIARRVIENDRTGDPRQHINRNDTRR
jgi:hypothetical protein